jgi:endonuclease/exonuclease/phosphatase family metal-dependent hydrolase
MKKVLICLFLLLGMTSMALTLKVMTYNIRHTRGIDDVVDLQRIIEVVRSEEPDILILNEVDQGNPRTAGVNQAGEIAGALGMNLFFGPTEETSYYGNAVLARFEIVQARSVTLPQPKWLNAAKRGATIVTLDVEGVQVMVIGTHLGLAGIKEIETELGEIYSLVRESGLPAIVAGDFNVEYFDLDNRMKEMIEDLRSVNHFLGIDLHTIPSNNPGPQIDYILASREFLPLNAYTVPSLASDHLPVVALLEMGR